VHDFFTEDDYRDAIKKRLAALKSRSGIKRFSFQKMAAYCSVEKSYFSKVFSGAGHLSSDQLFQIAEFLGLNQAEQEFLSLLFDRERSGLHSRKLLLQRKIDATRQQRLRSELAIKSPPLTENFEASKYYSDLNHLLVHMALMIPAYGKSLSVVQQALNLDEGQIANILQTLSNLHLIDTSTNPPTVLKSALHLPADSWLHPTLQQNLRVFALEHLRKSNNRDHHYGAVFAADAAARTKIKAMFIQFMGLVEPIVINAPAEHVYVINFDLFSTSL
jgi:transcriptional regulator with XRE-family HTH domain